MTLNNLSELRLNGFNGFKSIAELLQNGTKIPEKSGIYLVLKTDNEKPEFLNIGSGGFFKGKNPNVSIETLRKNWVNNTPVVYIGKATSLKRRLNEYLSFGQGRNVGHYGGRLIWQLKDSHSLIVCWKTTDHDPREIEKELIHKFYANFGTLPFANIVK